MDTVNPRELGIHGAIPAADADDELPAYVKREFDFSLRAALASDLPKRGKFVVMVGGSSTGKTRSLYEAVYGLVPDWWVIQPAAAAELLDWKNAPPRDTVFWLDELHHYLGADPPLTAECVRALVRHGNLVVGTLWPDQYARWTVGRADVHLLVKSAFLVPVPDALNAAELATAHQVARADSRIQDALKSTEVGMTQVLAGGPRLVMCWEQPANPYARAMLTVAADAHRLGVQSPLSEGFLADAMYGYLQPRYRVEPTEYWLTQALPPATGTLYGDVAPLFPVDDGRPGTLAGYTIADYLAQHVRSKRRTEPIPSQAWEALLRWLRRPEDLRRLAAAAAARLRYRYAEGALTRLVAEFDDGRAAVELADLLVGQDRLGDAVEVLRGRVDGPSVKKLARLLDLQGRVDQVRPPGRRSSSEVPAVVAEILFDGGVCDELRQEADAGDARSAERLAEILLDRGCLRELRDRADRGEAQFADALADLYAGWGEIDLLRERAEAGDAPAQLRLAKLERDTARAPEYQIAEYRRKVDEGDTEAPGALCSLLFDLRDEANLRAELDAGTPGAADRLLALYTAQDHPSLIRLRATGLAAAGRLYTP